MSTQDKLANPQFKDLLEEGKELRRRINLFLSEWKEKLPSHNSPSKTFQKKAEELKVEIRGWFNLLARDLLPFVLYERRQLNNTLNNILARVCFQEIDYEGNPHPLSGEDAQFLINEAVDEILTLIRAAPKNSPAVLVTTSSMSITHQPNTAFILMWMDPTNPDLVDVVATFKETFARFGIRAVRADDVEHEEKITDVVLDRIRNSEFIIADLTGERPNVYYEVGFAHALEKRPILFRKAGTPLHFDLGGYNVPEYQNLTDLKNKLQKRLEERTGKKSEESTTRKKDA